MACKLVCKGGKDVLELPSVEVISGTEEASTEESLVGDCFRERLGYGRFPGAGQSVEPKYILVPRVCSPVHDVLEDGLSSSRKTFIVMASLVSGIAHRLQLLQNFEVCSFLWEARVISTDYM